MERSDSLLAQLKTVKHLPLRGIILTMRKLAEDNLYLFDEIEGLVAAESDSILSTTVSEDRNKVVLAVLLAAVADDIGTLPTVRSRDRHLRRLNEVCRLLGVKYEDVHNLLRYLPAMQPILDSRPGSPTDGK